MVQVGLRSVATLRSCGGLCDAGSCGHGYLELENRATVSRLCSYACEYVIGARAPVAFGARAPIPGPVRPRLPQAKSTKLMQYINYRMRVTILDGRQLVGRFMAFDRHMNLVLGDCEEFRKLPAKKGMTEEVNLIMPFAWACPSARGAE